MNNNKNHNHLLLLTTLGVYLGLLVVGSAPGLIAQQAAATTRNFELSEEIEVKDDLDKKPDDISSDLFTTVNNYYFDLDVLIKNLKRQQSRKRADLSKDTFELRQSTALPCVAGNMVGSYTAEHFQLNNESLRPTLKWALNQFTDGYAFGSCIPSKHFNGSEATHSQFKLRFDENGLLLEITGIRKSAEDASSYFSALQNVWNLYRSRTASPLENLISNNTDLKTTGNKILVVTNLPRAALDELLAADAE